MNRQRLRTAIKLIVGLALLLWVVSNVDWASLRTHLLGLDAWVLAVVAIATVLEFGTRFGTWYVLLRTVGGRSLTTIAHVDLSIKFINHVVPSKAAGHAVAPLVLRHFAALEWSDAVGLTGSNTALYSGLYGVASAIGLLVFALALPPWLAIAIAASTGLYLFVAVTVALTGFGVGRQHGDRLLRLAARVPVARSLVERATDAIPGIAGPARQSFRAAVTSPKVVGLYALGLAGTLAVAPGIRVGLLLASFGAPFEPLYLLPICLVTAYSVTVMPITPGGVGVAEFSAMYVFVALGVPEAAIVPAILVDRFLGVYLPALLGWIPMMNVDLSSVLQPESVSGNGE